MMVGGRALLRAPLVPTVNRGVMQQWVPKYKHMFRATWYDTIYRKNDDQQKRRNFFYKAADPLHFDHDQAYINGGIKQVSELAWFAAESRRPLTPSPCLPVDRPLPRQAQVQRAPQQDGLHPLQHGRR